jgi:hypothetical protein
MTGCKALVEGKPDAVANARREYLEEKAASYYMRSLFNSFPPFLFNACLKHEL